MNGRYISLILAVQIGKWTAKFSIKLMCTKARLMHAEAGCWNNRPRFGSAGGTPLPLPPSRWHLRGSSRRQGREVRRKGSRFLTPLKSLLLFVFLNQCMLIHSSLSPSLIRPPFPPCSLCPHERLHLYLLFEYPLHSFPPVIWGLRC